MIDNKRCILIADDEPKMVRALRDFFRASGFCVLEAKNGIEAFDVFCAHTNEIDIILLDVMMPEQDGLTTLKEIRGASSLIPVILLTAKGEEYDQLSGFSSGADDYITKPFSPSLLMARVEAVLRRFGKDAQKDIVAGELTVNAMTRTVYLSGKELDLTRREYDLLYYLIVIAVSDKLECIFRYVRYHYREKRSENNENHYGENENIYFVTFHIFTFSSFCFLLFLACSNA